MRRDLILRGVATVGLGVLTGGCGGSPELSGPGAASDVSDVPAPPAAQTFRATVERVVDGDTFMAVRDGRQLRVRLIGIDAPESVQPEVPVECFGPQAADALATLLPAGKSIRGSYQADEPTDQYGRQLWDVWLDDGRFVQAELVRQGAAEARAYRPHTAHDDLLDRLEEAARDDSAGLHGACS